MMRVCVVEPKIRKWIGFEIDPEENGRDEQSRGILPGSLQACGGCSRYTWRAPGRGCVPGFSLQAGRKQIVYSINIGGFLKRCYVRKTKQGEMFEDFEKRLKWREKGTKGRKSLCLGCLFH